MNDGRFYFNSKEDAINVIKDIQSVYEQGVKIKAVGHNVLLDTLNMVVVEIKKSDGTKSIVLAFSCGRNVWKTFMPLADQMRLFPIIYDLYNRNDETNKIIWARRKK